MQKSDFSDYHFILVVATGRSGSTTLQRILNTIPETNICGENDNAILHLLEFYKSIKHYNIINAKYDRIIESGVAPSWYNHFSQTEMITSIRNLIIRFLNYDNNATTLGFKEIRYDKSNIHLLNEFKELFPNTKIIMHIRNPEIQSNSSWWADNPIESKKKLYELNKTFTEYHKKSSNTYVSLFDNLFNLDELNRMFVFLGKEQHFDKTKILQVLKNNLDNK